MSDESRPSGGETDRTPARQADGTTGQGDARDGPSPRRRQFLRGLTVPPVAAATAGCSVLGSGDDAIVEDLEPGDRTGYGGAIRFAESYAMETTWGGNATDAAGRFHGADRHLRFGTGERAVESYLVDGTGYVVADGECTEYPDLDEGLRSVGSVAPETGDLADPQLTVVGTDTVDGRPMLVLELPASEQGDADSAVTYYVDQETRHLRRLATASSTVEYRSWGEIDAIEPPDVDCRRATGEQSNRD